MTQFKRKSGEKFETFLRRFNKSLQQSGRLQEARQNQYLQKKKNKRKKKENALFGMKLQKQREYLKKIGKLPEDATKFYKK